MQVGFVSKARAERVALHLEAFARISETTPPNGVTRLAYTALEREAHSVFATHMRNLGLDVTVDAAGNTICELGHGTAKIIGTGSHLDSVPQGGRFDGTVGVVAAMEVATLLVEGKIPLNHRMRFVAFSAEEGARFAQACNGSRAAAGLVSAENLDHLMDHHGVTMAQSMRAVGLDPSLIAEAAWNPREWRAFVELHIEQGSILEQSGVRIGIVSAISGSSRLLVRVRGQATHSGGTPMRERRDALVAAAECVQLCNQMALAESDDGLRITVGTMQVHPGAQTTIPGFVEFTVDIRDHEVERLALTTTRLAENFQAIGTSHYVEVDVEQTGAVSPIALAHDVSRFSIAASQELGEDYLVLRSGASHDVAEISKSVSAGLIFVPSIRGLSHVAEEETTLEDVVLGTDVLLATLLQLDAA